MKASEVAPRDALFSLCMVEGEKCRVLVLVQKDGQLWRGSEATDLEYASALDFLNRLQAERIFHNGKFAEHDRMRGEAPGNVHVLERGNVDSQDCEGANLRHEEGGGQGTFPVVPAP